MDWNSIIELGPYWAFALSLVAGITAIWREMIRRDKEWLSTLQDMKNTMEIVLELLRKK